MNDTSGTMARDASEYLPAAPGLSMGAALARAFREHRLSLAIVVGMFLGGYAVQAVTGVPIMHPFLEFSGARLLPVMGIFALYGAGWVVALARYRAAGWPAAWRALRLGAFSNRRLASLLVGVLLIATLFDTYGQLKEAIPLLGGWTWDARLVRLDRILHGTDPWRLLFRDSRIIIGFDFAYGAWFLVLAAGLTWQVWQRDNRRFFLAFCLTWLLLGVFAAHAIPSAGPCYYSLVTHGDPFRPLLELLAHARPEAPLMALSAQEWLWSLHAAGQATNYTGISAFPSMHVAVPVLFALASGSRVARAFFTLFAAAIFLGSVQLGWHYAVDGEASILAVPLVWWLSGWLTDRYGVRQPGEAP